MHEDFPELIRRVTGADAIELSEVIQELWSGYGTIRRYLLRGSALSSVVVKHVRCDAPIAHPRGWNSDRSHRRKLRSYQVERAFYADWGGRCTAACRVPRSLAIATRNDETLMILEDLDAAGFPARLERVGSTAIEACLVWLANFHATFLGCTPTNLWEQGTYWHLATRPDELAALADRPLKQAASAIDQRLRRARFRTLVHGDAKLANFCFSTAGTAVAAVDFQYVGGGVGMQDVAYFIGSCLDEDACEQQESRLLDCYFSALRSALNEQGAQLDVAALEAEWRELFPWAWADFHRFLKGWSPGHWKLTDYSERLTRTVLDTLSDRRR